MSTYPTRPQQQQLTDLVELLITGKKLTALSVVGLASALAVDKRNHTLTTVLAAVLIGNKEWKKTLTVDSVLAMLPDIKAVLHFVALINGFSVDDLKEPKWVLKYAVFPRVAQRALLQRLATSQWLQLADAFKKKGLFKAVARNIHLGALVSAALKKAPQDEGLQQLSLFVSCLRGRLYPATQAEFDKTWRTEVLAPLLRLVKTNPLFDMSKKVWLEETFQANLVGHRLPKPAKRTVEAVLGSILLYLDLT